MKNKINGLLPVFLLLAAVTVCAALKEEEKGVFTEDYAPDRIQEFIIDKNGAAVPEVFEIDEKLKRYNLKGKFQTQVLYDKEFGDFSISMYVIRKKGAYAGLVVRDSLKAFFQMRNYFQVVDAKTNKVLFKSSKTFPPKSTIKVICSGPFVYFEVNDEPLFSCKTDNPRGKAGLYSHNSEASYGDIKIDTNVDPAYSIFVKPEALEDSLVFAPEKDLILQFSITNQADVEKEIQISASIKAWDDTLIKENTVSGKSKEKILKVEMGRIPEGFYKLEYNVILEGKKIASSDDTPLAVQTLPDNVAFKAPELPVGFYWAYGGKINTLYLNTYAHAAAKNFRDHNITFILGDSTFTQKQIDIFYSYGIAVLTRNSKGINSPGVIGGLTSDEPKLEELDNLVAAYAKLRKETDKPLSTCMIGEQMSFGDAYLIWDKLRETYSGPRTFRWYGFKKHFYNLVHNLKYKPFCSLSATLRSAEAISETPFWFVPQTFGLNVKEAYYQNPSPEETEGMYHLALAYGAKMIIGYTFQGFRTSLGVVDKKSLEAVDGKYAAITKVAALVKKHAELLKSLKYGGLDARCRNIYIEVVPRQEKDGKLYVYIINKSTDKTITADLLVWPETWSMGKVTSVFSGKNFELGKDKEGYITVPVKLKPGEGDLLLTDAAFKHKLEK